MTRPRPPREPDVSDRREARRTQLLEAAIEAIRAIGPNATMEQLARQGGVTKPILYRHFQDRDGLITAIAEGFSIELLGEIERPLRTATEPRQLMDLTIDGYLAFIERDPNLYRFLVKQAGSSTGVPQISPLIDTIAKQVALVIGEQLRSAGLDSGAAVPWAYGIVGMVHQAGDWWLDDRTMPRSTLTGYLSSLLWGGIEGTATAALQSRST
jgi:AcrR family transcriptional regulator